jgi:hypothetical protein
MSGDAQVIVSGPRYDLIVIEAEIHQRRTDDYADPYPVFKIQVPLPRFVDPAELSAALSRAVTDTMRRSWWQRLPGLWRGSR